MAARGSKGTQKARTEAERARLHAARRAWHDGLIRRRVRDNAIAVIAGVVLIAGAVVSQVVHAQVSPAEPSPSPTVEPTVPVEEPVETPAPEPAPEETPADVPAE
ncbi:hypothetical protein [Microbacterium sp. 179-I 3D4 NHS]|uniref:hypothetical protein n=1 Tax=Microbacterium sp. 179-I 3D4 NHS TaxID=3142381 RepID=UPI00399F2FC7